jgi:hypothetical protein
MNRMKDFGLNLKRILSCILYILFIPVKKGYVSCLLPDGPG